MPKPSSRCAAGLKCESQLHSCGFRVGKRELRSGSSAPPGPSAIAEGVNILLVDVKSTPLLRLPVVVLGCGAEAILDTGSQVNIISAPAVRRFNAVTERLQRRIRLQTADGSAHDATAGCRLAMQLGGRSYAVDFVVVPDFPDELLLGLAFMFDFDVCISPRSQSISIGSQRLPLPDAFPRTYPTDLAAETDLLIPARAEVVVNLVRICDMNDELVVCEGNETATALGLLVAASVCDTSDRLLPVRVANPTAKPVRIPRGTAIATAEAVVPLHETKKRYAFSTQLEPEAHSSPSDGTPATDHNSGTPPKRYFTEAELDMGKDLSPEQRSQVLELLKDFANIQSQHESDTGLTDLITHGIDTGSAAPINQRPYRISFQERQDVAQLVAEYVAAGFIRESDSPWACPIVIVRKKDGTLRFCCDWRRLNSVTRKDAMPLPRIDDMIDRLAKARYFTKLDFTSGYYQVPLSAESREKTAFVTPDGHYEWNVMGMGLTNAPATFQRLMYKVLGGLLWTNSMAYLDDIVIFSDSFEQHLSDLREVFSRIQKAKLKIKPPKCSFAKSGIHYLGFVITPRGVECDEANTRKVADFRAPRDKRDVRSFLGLTSYYRKFIRDYAFIARPLYDLTRDDVEFQWTERHQDAFRHLQEALVSPPILAFPDFTKQFLVTTDASGYGIGCVLKQLDEAGRERVIGYASRILCGAEQRYSVTEREILALKYATQIFRPYLHGSHFKVITDHRSLLAVKTMTPGSERLKRFVLDLEGFEFDVVYKPGKLNTDADAMSRYLDPEAEPVPESRTRTLVESVNDPADGAEKEAEKDESPAPFGSGILRHPIDFPTDVIRRTKTKSVSFKAHESDDHMDAPDDVSQTPVSDALPEPATTPALDAPVTSPALEAPATTPALNAHVTAPAIDASTAIPADDALPDDEADDADDSPPQDLADDADGLPAEAAAQLRDARSQATVTNMAGQQADPCGALAANHVRSVEAPLVGPMLITLTMPGATASAASTESGTEVEVDAVALIDACLQILSNDL